MGHIDNNGNDASFLEMTRPLKCTELSPFCVGRDFVLHTTEKMTARWFFWPLPIVVHSTVTCHLTHPISQQIPARCGTDNWIILQALMPAAQWQKTNKCVGLLIHQHLSLYLYHISLFFLFFMIIIPPLPHNNVAAVTGFEGLQVHC